jgi:ABC-type amino acid transport substrate-binding protein
MAGPGWHTTEVESLDLLEVMARAGRIDLFFESPEVMLALTRKLGKPPLGNAHIELLPGGLIPYTFGLRKSFPGAEMLIGQFNGALKRVVEDGRMEKALAPFRM